MGWLWKTHLRLDQKKTQGGELVSTGYVENGCASRGWSAGHVKKQTKNLSDTVTFALAA